jgi:hypothetical protein
MRARGSQESEASVSEESVSEEVQRESGPNPLQAVVKGSPDFLVARRRSAVWMADGKVKRQQCAARHLP